jgi:hypothetical protein
MTEMKMSLSAERLIDAAFATEGSHRTPDEAEETADRLHPGVGAFIGRGDLLGGPDVANEVIEELKRALAAKGNSREPDKLVNLWIRAEPWLDDREITSLWSDFTARLGDDPKQIQQSRGANAQGAGTHPQAEDR